VNAVVAMSPTAMAASDNTGERRDIANPGNRTDGNPHDGVAGYSLKCTRWGRQR